MVAWPSLSFDISWWYCRPALSRQYSLFSRTAPMLMPARLVRHACASPRANALVNDFGRCSDASQSRAPQLTTASERTGFDSFESAHTQHHAESCLTTPNLGESDPRPYPKSSKLLRSNFARPFADDSASADPPQSLSPPQPQIWIRPSWHACRRRCALVCCLPPM